MTSQHQFENHPTMQLALAHKATLGECLTWHAPTGRWWWTDIPSSHLYAWTPDLQAPIRFTAPDRVGSFALCKSGRLLLGLSKQLALADVPELLETSGKPLPVQFLADVDAAEARTRVNDGRTDRSGYFVFGTMNEGQDKRPIGSFYQFSLQHGLRRLALPAVSIANSICFAPDGKTMYFADSMSQNIMQCDYDAASAQVANVRIFTTVKLGSPDGSVIDSNGCLWNAQWGAGQVVQYAADGEELRTVTLAAKNPTCPAFGGAHFNQLLVTSARQGMSSGELKRVPAAGGLFGLTVAQGTGLADALFDDGPCQNSTIKTHGDTNEKKYS